MFELTKRYYFDIEAQVGREGRVWFSAYRITVFKTQHLILHKEWSRIFIKEYLMVRYVAYHQRHWIKAALNSENHQMVYYKQEESGHHSRRLYWIWGRAVRFWQEQQETHVIEIMLRKIVRFVWFCGYNIWRGGSRLKNKIKQLFRIFLWMSSFLTCTDYASIHTRVNDGMAWGCLGTELFSLTLDHKFLREKSLGWILTKNRYNEVSQIM